MRATNRCCLASLCRLAPSSNCMSSVAWWCTVQHCHLPKVLLDYSFSTYQDVLKLVYCLCPYHCASLQAGGGMGFGNLAQQTVVREPSPAYSQALAYAALHHDPVIMTCPNCGHSGLTKTRKARALCAQPVGLSCMVALYTAVMITSEKPYVDSIDNCSETTVIMDHRCLAGTRETGLFGLSFGRMMA